MALSPRLNLARGAVGREVGSYTTSGELPQGCQVQEYRKPDPPTQTWKKKRVHLVLGTERSASHMTNHTLPLSRGTVSYSVLILEVPRWREAKEFALSNKYRNMNLTQAF